LQRAENAFQFKTVFYLLRIANEMATNLTGLKEGLESCSDATFFNHTLPLPSSVRLTRLAFCHRIRRLRKDLGSRVVNTFGNIS
jgi:hypothetical protein